MSLRLHRIARLSALALALGVSSGWAVAQTAPAPAAIPDADATPLATGPRSDLHAQVLLDRAHFSPGQIDGERGSNQKRAVSGFQAARGLKVSGELDDATWQALQPDAAPPLVRYTLTAEDVAGPFHPVPKGPAAQAKLKTLGFGSIEEALGERFHASPELLKTLNPGVDLGKAGSVIQVPNIAAAPLPKASKLVIDKSDSTLRLFDADGKVYAQFPVSSGSKHDPLPIGKWKILGISRDPTFHYNPKLFWDAKAGDTKAVLPPGPNNPIFPSRITACTARPNRVMWARPNRMVACA